MDVHSDLWLDRPDALEQIERRFFVGNPRIRRRGNALFEIDPDPLVVAAVVAAAYARAVRMRTSS